MKALIRITALIIVAFAFVSSNAQDFEGVWYPSSDEGMIGNIKIKKRTANTLSNTRPKHTDKAYVWSLTKVLGSSRTKLTPTGELPRGIQKSNLTFK